MNNNIPNNVQPIPQPQTPVQPVQPIQPVQQQVQAPPAQPVNPVPSQPVQQPNIPQQQPQVPKPKEKKKKRGNKTLLVILLLLIIGAMGYYIYTDYQKDLKNKCSPLVPIDNKTKQLDINSTIVKDLYNKVKTNIREDIASNELNDQMKLYLASRQIPNNKIYESNCNLFDNNSMTSIKCIKEDGFIPTAFKEEDLQLEYKKLFGEEYKIENNSIQLGNSCIGGYQYIAERGEYVKGSCNNDASTIYNVEKKLLEATVTNDTITLKEKVRYYGSESLNIDRLQNGVYVYKFKLDNNYNYIYVSRTIEQ